MKVEEINKYIIEEMGLAEEQGDNVTIRLNLSDASSIRDRIDNPHLVPASPSLISGLAAAMSGEPSRI